MALFKSQVLTQASGSVGGLTFTRAKGGLVMRARAMPTDPSTALQATIRTAMTNSVNRFTSVLSPVNRLSWETYAAGTPTTNRLGDAIFLSGQNMFLRSQIVHDQVNSKFGLGLPDLSTAPEIFNLGDIGTGISATIDAVTGIAITMVAGSWAVEDDSVLLIFQGKPQNASRNYFRGPWRLAGVVRGDSVAPPVAFTVTIAQIASAGGFTVTDGQKMAVGLSVLRADARLTSRINLGMSIITP